LAIPPVGPQPHGLLIGNSESLSSTSFVDGVSKNTTHAKVPKPHHHPASTISILIRQLLGQ